MKSVKAAGLAALLALGAARAGAVPFPDGKTCAAWKTKNTYGLWWGTQPVGMNCAVTASVETLGGVRRLRVVVPIAKFDSRSRGRDRHVAGILKAGVQPELVFLSRAYLAAEWEALSRAQGAAMEGTLSIGGHEFPVTAPFSVVGDGGDAAAVGSVVTSFSAFAIVPPAVGGGLVAQVADYLELHYRIPLAQVAGR